MNSETSNSSQAATNMLSAHVAPDSALPTSARRSAFLVPFLALTRPGRAAVALVAASRPAFIVPWILGLLAVATVLVVVMLWYGTVELVWVPPLPATGLRAWLRALPFAQSGGRYQLIEKSIGQVWREWHADALLGWLGPAEATLILVLLLGSLLLPPLGWLNLPYIHRTGSVGGPHERSLRAGTGILWPLSLAILVCGAVRVHAQHGIYRAIATDSDIGAWNADVSIPVIGVSLWGLVLWLYLALRGAAPRVATMHLPPRCEACGYDLTHRPSAGRCPECGQDVDTSLVAERSRPERAWSRRSVLGRWWRTTWEVLWHTRRFYRTLPLRGPAGPARVFAIGSYVLLLGSGLGWFVVGWLVDGFRHGLASILHDVGAWTLPDSAILAGLLLIAAFFVWLMHRLVGALAVTWWLVRKTLPDYGWSTKVIAYESGFIWAYSLYWGALSISYVIGDSWISNLFGWTPWGTPFLWLPAEVAAYFVGTAVLGAVWLWRFHVAGRAIRWSNF